MDNNTKIYEWISDASGDATVEVEPRYAGKKLNWVKTIPGAGVSAYTLTIMDSDGFDQLCGEGTARSTSATEVIFAQSDVILPNGSLTLTVSGAGDAKTGTVKNVHKGVSYDKFYN